MHNDIKKLENKYFYNDGEKIYFIFSNYYSKVGQVKVLFDTTPYIKSQIIIIKISFIAILFFLILNYFLGKYVSSTALEWLKKISEEVKNINLDTTGKIGVPKGPKNDEIVILAHGINKTLERIRFQADNLKQFITDVSHEFKTPLMAINSGVDLALKKNEKWVLRDTDIIETFHSTKNSIKKMNGLLETLFYLAKVEEGITILMPQKIQARDFIQNKIDEVKKVFSHNRIEFIFLWNLETSFTVQEELLWIVVENLLTNAIKFSHDTGKIEITISKNSLEIRDFGIGMTSEELEKVWHKFYKKDVKKEGFGIGLFLVKRICEVCNWKIDVVSQLEKWTKFTLKIS